MHWFIPNASCQFTAAHSRAPTLVFLYVRPKPKWPETVSGLFSDAVFVKKGWFTEIEIFSRERWMRSSPALFKGRALKFECFILTFPVFYSDIQLFAGIQDRRRCGEPGEKKIPKQPPQPLTGQEDQLPSQSINSRVILSCGCRFAVGEWTSAWDILQRLPPVDAGGAHGSTPVMQRGGCNIS